MKKKSLQHKFLMWSTTPILVGGLISIGLASCQPTRPIQDVTIQFNANEGTFPGGSTTYDLKVKDDTTWADIITNPPPSPTKPGKWKFDKWSKSPDKLVSPELTDTFKDGTTLYAYYSNHEHNYSYYRIIPGEEGMNEVFGFCNECQTWVPLSYDEISLNTGKILIQRENTADYYDIFEGTIADAINAAPKISNKVKLYLFGGNYSLADCTSSVEGGLDVEINPIANEEANWASIDCSHNGDHIYALNINFELNDLYLTGNIESGSLYSAGIQSSKLICNRCYLNGMQTAYAPICKFNSCVLDSTKFQIYKDSKGKWKTEYAMYVYQSPDITFSKCRFKSHGKAIKVYNEGSWNQLFVNFEECTFEFVLNTTLGETQLKPCVATDSFYQTADTNFHITIKKCSSENYPEGYKIWGEDEDSGVTEGDPKYPDVTVIP